METISNRQKELISAAGKILTKSGVQGLTIKNLAKEMSFSESAIYRHFNSKEEIIIAMLNHLAEDMDDRYIEIVSRESEPTLLLISLFKNQFQFFSKNPHFVVVVFSDGLIDDNERVLKSIKKIMSIKMKHLLPIIIDGQNQGIFRNDIDAENLMQIIMGTFRLQMFKWRMENFTSDIEIQGDIMLNNIIKLIKSTK